MLFLSWHRVAANHHELRDLDDVVWAEVRRDPDGRRPRADVRNTDFRAKDGHLYWVIGNNVTDAKNNVVRWMQRHDWCASSFEVVPADVQAEKQAEHDDAVAAVAEAVRKGNEAAEAAAAERRAAREDRATRRAALAAAQMTFAF